MRNLLLISISVLIFFSCSKNDNASPKIVSVTGKWDITGDTSQTVGYPPYIIVGLNSPYMQFNTDGTGTEKNNIGIPDDVLNFTYTISNNVIMFNFPVQPGNPYINIYNATIKKLTSSNLILESDLNNPTITVKELVYLSR